MKQFVLGDPHGGYKAMLQVFAASGFNPEKDELIVLGDVCDGWPEVKECFDLLLTCKKLIFIMGNHDYWARTWYRYDCFEKMVPDECWTSQGGQATIDSYGGIDNKMTESHLSLLDSAVPYCLHISLEWKMNLFVHGGINPSKPMNKQDSQDMMWDRRLLEIARFKHNQKPDYRYGGFTNIFVGHTTTRMFKEDNQPIHWCNVWNLDTGGGWGGVLTIMDINTKEYWQSDVVKTLYPEERGR